MCACHCCREKFFSLCSVIIELDLVSSAPAPISAIDTETSVSVTDSGQVCELSSLFWDALAFDGILGTPSSPLISCSHTTAIVLGEV